MYSLYLHDKIQEDTQISIRNHETSLRILKNQQKNREKLLKKYKNRVVSRVVDLSQNPVEVSHKERTQSERFLGARLFRTKPKDSRDRVQDAITQQSFLDLIPLDLKKFQLRPREKQLEIQSDMKFTPKDRFQRIADQWHRDKDIIYSWAIKNGEVAKGKKLCFKTLETVALGTKERNKSSEFGSKDLIEQIALKALKKCKLRSDKKSFEDLANNWREV